ncbi:MAG TPA: primosomal protein N' [Candidatus Hydrothermia bacterium]|nr:primosomal protein N' [Candidatus Hydrothermia bacterium]HOK23011.1 primosomal protein N' [Candidatus Hydrothermia bacterium]HOL23729.1 primosomal protein N' [Candidatus Hydrothermia bacterium]HPO78734.1 primosomal protein N' [Candidatus Hydrothermia bacterium]
MSSKNFAKVVIPHTRLDYFTYKVPRQLMDTAAVGSVVVVPFMKTHSKGVIYELSEKSDLPEEKVKLVEAIMTPEFSTSSEYIELAKWISDYYVASLSEVIPLFFPPGIVERGSYIYKLAKKNIESKIPLLEYLSKIYPRGASLKTLQKLFGSGVTKILSELQAEGVVILADKVKIKKYRKLDFTSVMPIHIPEEPTPEQNKLIQEFFKDRPSVSLIFGITGSGKTRVYSWMIEKILEEGKSALVMVPEIALTPQVFNYFNHIFKGQVVYYHSRLSQSERRWIFKEVREGNKKIVIGPRSSLFLPIKNLGIIVIDEEHDSSYKEIEKNPAYHARDVAIKLGEILKIPIILGSASPSLESYYKTSTGEYHMYKLTERVPQYRSPEIGIIDLRKRRGEYLISIELLNEIQKNLNENKQVILFLNRRGHSTFLMCTECGNIFQCPHCSVNLVFHKLDHRLHCHICNYTYQIPEICPNCGSMKLKLRGTGTQKVEEAVKNYFPDVEMARFDLDAFLKEGLNEKAFKDFFQGKLKLLVGTKMVGKGFDFPGLGLVGVINADIGLGLPDFRAEEKVFQLILQIAGRIRTGGKVLIQTYNPESRAIKYASAMDYESFAESELKEREQFAYPPFYNLTLLEFSGQNTEDLVKHAESIRKRLLDINPSGLEVLGPVPSPVAKKGGNYFVRLILKYLDRNFPLKLNFLKDIKLPRNITFSIDVDPQDLL